ncbi:MAG: hypothetical protein AAB875_00160 [Patescibacteria group bacterium]
MIDAKSKNVLLILVGAALILGAIWYFYLRNQVTPADINKLYYQSQSDEVAAIEKDLNNTDFADLDAELADIEAELNAP